MPNKNFKLSDEDPTHIFDSHKKIAIFVAIFITVILCVVILLLVDENNKKSKNNFVENAQKKVELINEYKKEVKQIIKDFLVKRDLDEFKTKEDYQNFISSTLKNVLNLKVSVEFKDFHLNLVILLDKEIQNDGDLSAELEDEWNKLLDENSWINN